MPSSTRTFPTILNEMTPKSLVTFVVLCSVAAGASYPGTQLATVVRNVFRDHPSTVDICVLYDSPTYSWSWRRFLDDFMGGISTGQDRVVLSRLGRLSGVAIRKFRMFLIYLDGNLDEDGLSIMYNDLVRSKENLYRFGKFVYVTTYSVKDVKLQKRVEYLYFLTVTQLGISNSILMLLNENDENNFLLLYCDYFKMTASYLSMSQTEESLRQDKLRDVHRFPFKALLYENFPFLQIVGSSFKGFDIVFLMEFTKHINAKLEAIDGLAIGYERRRIKDAFANVEIHMVNFYKPCPPYTELIISPMNTGYCFLIPEKLIGPIFDHLMRPFSLALWITIVLLLGCIISLNKFPHIFPRGIFNQLFHGSLIADYRMICKERVTLFSSIVVLFILSNAYEAKLFQLLFEAEYEPHLSTLQDLADTNHEIYVTFRLELFKNFLPNKQHHVTNETNDFLAHQVTLQRCSAAYVYAESCANFNPKTGKRKFYALKDSIPSWSDSYTFTRQNPYGQKFRQTQQRFFESGLLEFWVRMFSRLNPPLMLNIDVVTFSDMISLWKLVAAGYVLGSISFLMELAGGETVSIRVKIFGKTLNLHTKLHTGIGRWRRTSQTQRKQTN